MLNMGRGLLVLGLMLAALGLFLEISGQGSLRRLPGDLAFRLGDLRVNVLWALSLFLSVFLSLALWLFRR